METRIHSSSFSSLGECGTTYDDDDDDYDSHPYVVIVLNDLHHVLAKHREPRQHQHADPAAERLVHGALVPRLAEHGAVEGGILEQERDHEEELCQIRPPDDERELLVAGLFGVLLESPTHVHAEVVGDDDGEEDDAEEDGHIETSLVDGARWTEIHEPVGRNEDGSGVGGVLHVGRAYERIVGRARLRVGSARHVEDEHDDTEQGLHEQGSPDPRRVVPFLQIVLVGLALEDDGREDGPRPRRQHDGHHDGPRDFRATSRATSRPSRVHGKLNGDLEHGHEQRRREQRDEFASRRLGEVREALPAFVASLATTTSVATVSSSSSHAAHFCSRFS